jgi:nicotinamide-nucleotide amidase
MQINKEIVKDKEIILRCVGLKEEEIREKLKELTPKIDIILKSHIDGIVDVKLTQLEEPLAEHIERELKNKLKDNLYGKNKETLEEVVGNLLSSRNLTLAVAESCTGGLVSHRLTNVAGSSAYFCGGAIGYSENAKISLIGVAEDLLKRYGSVSKEVVMAMARGVAELLASDFGLATVGYAGPKGEEVGLIYVALYIRKENKIEVKSNKFTGTREGIKEQAATFALDTLRRYLLMK